MNIPTRLSTLAIAGLLLAGCDPGECDHGERQSEACGDCGERVRTCTGKVWGPWSGCEDEGVCTPGAVAIEDCGRDLGPCELGERQRSCTEACEWDAWTDCAGGVAPEAEVCGDTVDNNCNDVVDEYCTCAAADEAQDAFTFGGFVVNMVADPHRCLVYVAAHNDPQVLVIDLDTKAALGTVPLDANPTAMSLSPDGLQIVLAHGDDTLVSVVDTAVWTVESVELAHPPATLALGDHGELFYADGTGGQVRWVDLDRGGPTDVVAFPSGKRVIDLALDGDRLYVGQSNPRELAVYDAAPPYDRLDASTAQLVWPSFDNMRRVTPFEGGVYFAGSLFDDADLDMPYAVSDEPLHAATGDGQVGVGSNSVWDLQVGRPVGGLAEFNECAAVVLDDAELWSGWGEFVWFTPMASLLQDARLGEADPTPLGLSSYLLQRPLHDPARDLLHGVDPTLWALVSVDVDGLVPVVEHPLSAPPSMLGRELLTMSPEGGVLYFADFVYQQVVAYDPVTLTETSRFDVGAEPERVLALADDWLVVVTEDEDLLLFDASTGVETDRFDELLWRPTVAASADGTVLFVGELNIEPAFVRVMGFDTGELVELEFASRQDYDQALMRAVPDGSAVFHGEALLEAEDLSIRYTLPETVVAVSGDSRLAFSAGNVYRVSDGEALGALPATAAEPAPSPDGAWLYLAQDGDIEVVDLSSY